jgi:hypothetical protein
MNSGYCPIAAPQEVYTELRDSKNDIFSAVFDWSTEI